MYGWFNPVVVWFGTVYMYLGFFILQTEAALVDLK